MVEDNAMENFAECLYRSSEGKKINDLCRVLRLFTRYLIYCDNILEDRGLLLLMKMVPRRAPSLNVR